MIHKTNHNEASSYFVRKKNYEYRYNIKNASDINRAYSRGQRQQPVLIETCTKLYLLIPLEIKKLVFFYFSQKLPWAESDEQILIRFKTEPNSVKSVCRFNVTFPIVIRLNLGQSLFVEDCFQKESIKYRIQFKKFNIKCCSTSISLHATNKPVHIKHTNKFY